MDVEPEPEINDPGQEWGEYRILETLARGGSGIVYRARNAQGTEVAIKMLADAGLADPDEIRRFRLEAEVIASLDHPHIIRLLEAGERGGRLYFIMTLAPGGSLATRLAEQAFPFPPDEAARTTALLAGAVDHAHGHGVLHRDLKPGNILLAADGSPLVSDFGLARLTHGAGGATITGTALGTPAYMAPEQARGAAATTASDVYGLGAILYHLLTGHPPFEGGTPLEIMRRLATEDPVPPRGLVPSLPRDLATICMRCLAKEPARRYRSAAELADDLRRWLDGGNVQARPAAWPERTWKWARRHPAYATLLAALTAGAGILGTVLVQGHALLRTERNEALHQAARATDGERSMALNVYAADLFLARRAFEDGHLGAARSALERQVPAAGTPDLRGYEWHALERQCQGDEARTLATHAAAVPAVAFSPDGLTALTGGRDGALRFWKTDDGSPLRALPQQPGTPALADFATLAALPVRSPEVAQVLSGSATFEEVRMRARPSKLGEISCVAWSPDGKWTITGGLGSYVRLWRVEDLALHGFIPVTTAEQLAFTPDSAEIVLALSHPGGGEVRRYAVASLARLETLATPVPAFALAADVPELAIIGDSKILLRHVDGTQSVSWSVDLPVRSLALSPDGSRLAAFGQENGTLRHARTGGVIAGLSPEQGLVRSPVFSSDGNTLAAGCAGQAVVTFDGRTGQPRQTLRGHIGEVLSVAFHPGNSQILSGSSDHTARLWPLQANTSPDTEILPHREDLVAVTEDGGYLLGGNAQGHVFCRRPDTREAAVPQDQPRLALTISGSGESVRFLTRRADAAVLEWWHADATPDGAPVPLSCIPAMPKAIAASRDGRLIAVSDQSRVSLCDTRSGQIIRTLPAAPLRIESLRLSADGSLLIAREYPCFAAVADTTTGQWLWRERLTSGTLGPMVFSPDQSLLATGADDAIVTIRSARTGAILTTLREHLSEIGSLAFSADGRTLASASKDRTLRLWHVPTWRPLGPLRRDMLCSSLHFTARGLHAAEYGRRWLLILGK